MFFVERFSSLGGSKCCRNFTGTVSHVLCREVYYVYCVLIWESRLSEFPIYTYVYIILYV